jgi:hypothetical protein
MNFFRQSRLPAPGGYEPALSFYYCHAANTGGALARVEGVRNIVRHAGAEAVQSISQGDRKRKIEAS